MVKAEYFREKGTFTYMVWFCPFIWFFFLFGGCDLDILKFLPVYLILVPFGGAILTSWNFCPFIWFLFCDLDILKFLPVYLIFVPFGGAFLTSWNFCPFISIWWCDLDILNFLPVYLIFVPFGGAFLIFYNRDYRSQELRSWQHLEVRMGSGLQE